MKKGYLFRMEEAKIIEAIDVQSEWGSGTEEDPHRIVKLYFSKMGTLLALDDPIHRQERVTHDLCMGM